jgi:hypothetical protein
VKYPKIVPLFQGNRSRHRSNNVKQNSLGCPPNQAFAPLLRITNSFPLKQALALIDVKVLDHFVVGRGATVSFAESGLL